MAADYCLPAAVVCLEPYLCVEAASFFTGFVKGYNADFFEPTAPPELLATTMLAWPGGVLNLLPGKAASNVASKGGQLAASVAAKELSGAAANTIATKASKWFSWFKPSAAPISQTAQKTAQAAEKRLAKDGVVKLGQINHDIPTMLEKYLGHDSLKNEAQAWGVKKLAFFIK